jgi:hypothetical protein
LPIFLGPSTLAIGEAFGHNVIMFLSTFHVFYALAIAHWPAATVWMGHVSRGINCSIHASVSLKSLDYHGITLILYIEILILQCFDVLFGHISSVLIKRHIQYF